MKKTKQCSEYEIHFTNHRDLQTLESVETVVFDLNDTLREGSIEVKKLEIEDEQFFTHYSDDPKNMTILSHNKEFCQLAITKPFQKEKIESGKALLTRSLQDRKHIVYMEGDAANDLEQIEIGFESHPREGKAEQHAGIVAQKSSLLSATVFNFAKKTKSMAHIIIESIPIVNECCLKKQKKITGKSEEISHVRILLP